MEQQDLLETWSQLAEQSQRVVQAFAERQEQDGDFSIFDPQSIAQAFIAASAALMSDPAKLMEAQIRFWQDSMALWQNAAQRLAGRETEPLAEPARSDRRFKDEAWVENPLYDYIKQSYLLASRWVQGVVGEVEGLDPKDKEKVEFYTRQYLSALSPSNFATMNPQVVRKTLDSGGKNLLSGLKHLLDDLEQGKGRLQISMTDQSAFSRVRFKSD